MNKTGKNGLFLLFCATCMFSIGGVCFACIPFHPLAANGMRCAIAAGLSIYFLRRDGQKLRLNAATLTGGLCLALTTNLFALAVPLAGPAAATLLLNTSPLFVAGILWVRHKKCPPMRQLAAAVLAVGGVAIAAGGMPGQMTGLAVGLASGACYAGVFCAGQGQNAHPPSAFFLGQCIGAAAGLPFLAFVRPDQITPLALGAAAVLGLVQLGYSYRLLAKGMALSGPMAASVVCSLEPVLGTVWPWLLGGGAPGIRMAAGAALLALAAVTANSTGGSAPAPQPSR